MRIYDELRHEVAEHALTHMIEAIHATPAQHDPFPHFIAEGIFPADLYREMLSLLPKPSHYEVFSYEKHSQQGESNRQRFRLTDESLQRLAGRQQSLWMGVRD